MKVKVKQTSVVVERGDITDWEVDAIVNAANS
ncbi:MAG: O-acetyl-ADP-ribose deacetylase, partial [Candidatus Rokubacteria bacterium]|nr:O-acetyl-ADP-ribose deacetylase [Candidatus Rokubacteria bacterium]